MRGPKSGITKMSRVQPTFPHPDRSRRRERSANVQKNSPRGNTQKAAIVTQPSTSQNVVKSMGSTPFPLSQCRRLDSFELGLRDRPRGKWLLRLLDLSCRRVAHCALLRRENLGVLCSSSVGRAGDKVDEDAEKREDEDEEAPTRFSPS